MTLIQCCCWNNPGRVPRFSISTWMSSLWEDISEKISLPHLSAMVHHWWATNRDLVWPVTGPQGWKEAFGRSILLAQWLSSKHPLLKPAVLLAAMGAARKSGVPHGFLLGLSFFAGSACYMPHHLQVGKHVFCSRNCAPWCPLWEALPAWVVTNCQTPAGK